VLFQTTTKAVVPSAIQNAAPTGKKLKEKDLEFCRKHTRFDDKERGLLTKLTTNVVVFGIEM